jgi:hypothetical protein
MSVSTDGGGARRRACIPAGYIVSSPCATDRMRRTSRREGMAVRRVHISRRPRCH